MVPSGLLRINTNSSQSLSEWKATMPSMRGPHPDCNWVCPRLLVGAYPGHNRSDNIHEQRLKSLLEAGVRTFVSLLPVYETFALRPYEDDFEHLSQKELQQARRTSAVSLDELRRTGRRLSQVDELDISHSVRTLGRQQRLESLSELSSTAIPAGLLSRSREDNDSDDDSTSVSSKESVEERRLSTTSECSSTAVVPSSDLEATRQMSSPYEQLDSSVPSSTHSLEFLNEPITDRDITSDDVLSALADSILDKMREGRVVYLHCWAGRGRSGTVAAVVAARYWGIDADSALQLIQQSYNSREDVRGYSTPETSEQVSQVKRVLRSTKRKLPLSACPSPLAIPPRSRPRLNSADRTISPREHQESPRA